MLQQITGQMAQQAPPLPNTMQEITHEAASKLEPQAKDKTKENAVKVAKTHAVKSKRKMSESSDTSSASRYLFFLLF